MATEFDPSFEGWKNRPDYKLPTVGKPKATTKATEKAKVSTSTSSSKGKIPGNWMGDALTAVGNWMYPQAPGMVNAVSPDSTQGFSWSDYVNTVGREDRYGLGKNLRAAGIPGPFSTSAKSSRNGGDTTGGGPGGSYDPAAGYKAQSAQDRAQLQALYNAYYKAIANNASGINTQYEANQATLGDIYGQAATDVNAGYNAARDAQTQQWERLGLANLLGAPPQETFSGQLAQAGRYTDLGAGAKTFSEAQRQAALAGNTSLGNAIRGEQRTALSDYDRMVRENVTSMEQQAANNAAAAANAQARAQAAAAKLAYDRAWRADERDYQRQQDAANYALRQQELNLKYPQ